MWRRLTVNKCNKKEKELDSKNNVDFLLSDHSISNQLYYTAQNHRRLVTMREVISEDFVICVPGARLITERPMRIEIEKWVQYISGLRSQKERS